jgi:hypothetical protein
VVGFRPSLGIIRCVGTCVLNPPEVVLRLWKLGAAPNRDSDAKMKWHKWVLGAIAAAVVAAIWSASCNQQIAPPIPGATPAPVVSDLPGIVEFLSRCRSQCEAHAKMAKQHVRGILHERVLARGEQLYGKTKAEFDGCIDFLKSGLSRRFNDGDPPQIKQMLESARAQMSRFIGWYDSPKADEQCCAEAGPDWVAPLTQIVTEWLKITSQQNEAAIKQLRDDLEGCRFRDWDIL